MPTDAQPDELAKRPTGEELWKFIESYCGFPNAAWDHPTEPDYCTDPKERDAWNALAELLNARLESLAAENEQLRDGNFESWEIDGRIEVYYRHANDGRKFFCYRIPGSDCGPFPTWGEAYHHAQYTLVFQENAALRERLEAEREIARLKGS